ncbi:MAG: DUF1592 domain-containing protein [Steroidobacteraceae bacterium]|jgi:hypothetical protein|nr:DUF1592 domain-containing protein [Steroidobacteraceae bacterium]
MSRALRARRPAGAPRAARIAGALFAGVAALATLAGCATAEPPSPAQPPTLRRLTEQQYRNTIRDVFGPGIVVVGRFDPISREGGLLAVGAAQASITPSGFERLGKIAESIAGQVVATGNRDYLLPCQPADAAAADPGCARRILSTTGRLLYRRALTEAELGRLLALSEKVSTTLGSFHEGIAFALTAMLQSPEFLFVADAAEPDPAQPGKLRLSALSKASRLSFFLWNSSPDEALLAAAESGALHTPEGLGEQVQRLLGSPRLEDGVRALFSDMLSLENFDTLQKDATIYPKFGLEVTDDAREQLLRTLVDHLVVRDADYRQLYTTRRTFVSGPLGMIYQVPVDDPNGWTAVELPRESPYHGIVTLPGFSALHSHAGRSSPTLRGRAVRELVMCQRIPDPPASVDFSQFNHASQQKVSTARERLTIHNTEKTCASCHALVDPIGLALEHFDGAAQFRTIENDALIDTRGDLDGVKFEDAAGLGEALAKSPAVTNCLVNRAFAYSRGRAAGKGDNDLLQWLHERFAADGYRLRGLLESIATSEAFFAVSPPKAAPAPASRTAGLEAAPQRETRS